MGQQTSIDAAPRTSEYAHQGTAAGNSPFPGYSYGGAELLAAPLIAGLTAAVGGYESVGKGYRGGWQVTAPDVRLGQP